MPTPPMLRGKAYTPGPTGGGTAGRLQAAAPNRFIVVPLGIVVVPLGSKAVAGLYGVVAQE